MVAVQATHIVGIGLALFASLSIASSNLFIRKGTDTGRAYDAILIVMLTNICVLVPVVGIYYYPEYGLTQRSFLSFLGAGVLGTLFGRVFKYISIDKISASRTEPIIRVSALVATALGVVFLGERVSVMQLVAIVTIIIGVGLISAETTRENPHNLSRRQLLLGMVLPFAGALAYGVEPIFASYGLQLGTPAPVGATIKTVAATFGFIVYLRLSDSLPGRGDLQLENTTHFVLAGLGNTAFILSYYLALGIAPVSVVVPLLPTSILFTIVLAALFMPQRLERVTLRLVFAASIVVAGVITLTVTS
jgi:uncharacterized membrane protein